MIDRRLHKIFYRFCEVLHNILFWRAIREQKRWEEMLSRANQLEKELGRKLTSAESYALAAYVYRDWI